MRVRNLISTGAPIAAAAVAVLLAIPFVAQSQGQGKGKAKGPAATPRQAAPFDPTGYWVSIVTEDWRYRMVTPPKGAYGGVPMNAEARKVAAGWDPAKDEAANQQCKSYGAAALMRVPGRIHVTWENDTTLKIEADAGTQTRTLHFGGGVPQGVEPSWQGYSVADWELAPAGAKGAPRTGDLKIVTTRLLPGYLRKNGVPYSGNAVVTEWVDRITDVDGNQWLNFNTEVRDPQYLTQPFITSSHFKKQADATGFAPEACFAK
jgi:hypothetical protein